MTHVEEKSAAKPQKGITQGKPIRRSFSSERKPDEEGRPAYFKTVEAPVKHVVQNEYTRQSGRSRGSVTPGRCKMN
jgi:hypothetical protein